MVVTSWHLEILGGTSSKDGNILLTEKHLELLGGDQLNLEVLGGDQFESSKNITCRKKLG